MQQSTRKIYGKKKNCCSNCAHMRETTLSELAQVVNSPFGWCSYQGLSHGSQFSLQLFVSGRSGHRLPDIAIIVPLLFCYCIKIQAQLHVWDCCNKNITAKGFWLTPQFCLVANI